MQIIPAIDVINGKCVRLFQGTFSKVTDYQLNPLEQAKLFADLGFEHLHLVDLDGVRNGFPVNLRVLEHIAAQTTLKVDFGGGLRDISSIDAAFNAGAWKVNLGSALNTNLIFAIVEKIKGDKIIGAVDCERELVKLNGWQSQTTIKVDEFITSLTSMGIDHCTVTDISRDGTLTEPAFELYEKLKTQHPGVKIWASGGVSCLTDIVNLSKIGLDGVIVGKAIYEKQFELKDLLKCLQNE